MSELDFTMDWDADVPQFPFIEDENANITGRGHQDKARFADEVNRFESVCNGGVLPFDEDEQWTADDIGHGWVVLGADDEELLSEVGGELVTSATPGAIPVTTLWGAR